MIDKFKALKMLFAIAAFVGPYFALGNLVTLPPTTYNLASLLTGVVNLFVVGLVIANEGAIRRSRTRYLTVFSLSFLVIGMTSAVYYTRFAETHVLSVGYRHQIYILPDDPSQRIKDMVDPYGSNYREAIINHPRWMYLVQYIHEENNRSSATIIISLLVAEALMLLAVMMLVWRAALR